MDQYLDHLVHHTASGLPLSPGAAIRQNTLIVKPGEKAWGTVTSIKSKRVFTDPFTGNAVFWGAVESEGKIAAMSTRLRVVNAQITEVEIVFNGGEEGPFNADFLLEPDMLYDSPLPEGSRVTRDELVGALDGYWEAVGTHNPGAGNYSLRCIRSENGMNMTAPARQPGTPSPCGSSLSGLKGQQTIERRYPVVDVERGVIVSYTFIEHRERTPPQALYISALAKIDKGKLREMDAINITVPHPATAGFHQ